MKKTVAVLLVVAMAFLCFGCAKTATPLGEADVTDNISVTENETFDVTKDPEGPASFIGLTVKDITDRFGTDFEVTDYRGGFYICYANQPFIFLYKDPEVGLSAFMSDVPDPADEIFSVTSYDIGAPIFGDVRIGSPLEDAEICLGEDIEIDFSEMDGYCAYFERNDIAYRFWLDGNCMIEGYDITKG